MYPTSKHHRSFSHSQTADSSVLLRSAAWRRLGLGLALWLGLMTACASASDPLAQDFGHCIKASAKIIAMSKVLNGIEDELGFYEGGGCLFGVDLNDREMRSMTLMLEADRTYVFLGCGDENAADVDIIIKDGHGMTLAADTKTDATPVVTFKPSTTGKYQVHLKLHDSNLFCTHSYCAMTVLQAGGWSVPIGNLSNAMGNLITVANNVNLSHPNEVRLVRGTDAWSLYGTVMRKGEVTTLTEFFLKPGRHATIVAADKNANTISAELSTSTGMVLGKEVEGNKHSVVRYATDLNPSLVNRTELVSSNGASLVLICFMDLK